jgi:hypothetical protein
MLQRHRNKKQEVTATIVGSETLEEVACPALNLRM